MKTILILFSTVLLGMSPFTTTENSKEAFNIIKEAYVAYRLKDSKFCLNYQKYKI